MCVKHYHDEGQACPASVSRRGDSPLRRREKAAMENIFTTENVISQRIRLYMVLAEHKI